MKPCKSLLLAAGILAAGISATSAALITGSTGMELDPTGATALERGVPNLHTFVTSKFTVNDAGIRNPGANLFFEGTGLYVGRKEALSLSTVNSNYRNLFFSAGEGFSRDFQGAGGAFASGTGAGWYRIAETRANGIWNSPSLRFAKGDAIFTLRCDWGSNYQNCRIKAGSIDWDLYSASLGLISQTWTTSHTADPPFSKVRLIRFQDPSPSVEFGVALEVWVENVAVATFSILDNTHHTGWIPVNWEKRTTTPGDNPLVRQLLLKGRSSAESAPALAHDSSNFNDPNGSHATAPSMNVFSVSPSGKVLVSPQGGLSMGTFKSGALP